MTKRMVRFIYRGTEVVAEPHLLGRAKRTRAFYLKAFVGEQGWYYFSYAEIRDFEIRRDAFGIRPGLWDSERKIVECDTEVRTR